MSNVAERLMSLDEFLAWERDQPERYEYARGVITMMTGGSLDHSTIASNLWTALRDQLRGSPCRAFRGESGPRVAVGLSSPCSPTGFRIRTGSEIGSAFRSARARNPRAEASNPLFALWSGRRFCNYRDMEYGNSPFSALLLRFPQTNAMGVHCCHG